MREKIGFTVPVEIISRIFVRSTINWCSEVFSPIRQTHKFSFLQLELFTFVYKIHHLDYRHCHFEIEKYKLQIMPGSMLK